MLTSRSNTSLKALLLIVLVFVIYYPCYLGGFIWDDWTIIVNSPVMQASNGLKQIWFSTNTDDYWPITYTIFWFATRVFQNFPLGYHLLNISVHVLNALLLWAILSKLNFRYSYWAALIFAVHPVNVESVAWIFQLKTTLSAGLAWLSCWFWIDFDLNKVLKSFFISLGAFLLALLTKTAVITLPLILLGYTFYKKRKFVFKDKVFLAPYFALSFIFGVFNIFYWYPTVLVQPIQIRAESFFVRFLTACKVFWFYLYKTAVPLHLSFNYPLWHLNISEPDSYLPLIALVGVLVYLSTKTKDFKQPAAFAYTLVALIPVLGFNNIYFMLYSLVSDHWQYFAIIGNIVIVLIAMEKLLKGFKQRTVRIIFYLIVATFSFFSYQRAGVFVSEEKLWAQTLEENPDSALALNSMGVNYLKQGQYPEALANFKRALSPNAFEAYNNIGVVHAIINQFDIAEDYYKRSLEINPYYPNALSNLHAVLKRRDDLKDMESYYLKATTASSNRYKVDAFNDLGQLYLELHQPEKAIESFEEALRLDPGNKKASESLLHLK